MTRSSLPYLMQPMGWVLCPSFSFPAGLNMCYKWTQIITAAREKESEREGEISQHTAFENTQTCMWPEPEAVHNKPDPEPHTFLWQLGSNSKTLRQKVRSYHCSRFYHPLFIRGECLCRLWKCFTRKEMHSVGLLRLEDTHHNVINLTQSSLIGFFLNFQPNLISRQFALLSCSGNRAPYLV